MYLHLCHKENFSVMSVTHTKIMYASVVLLDYMFVTFLLMYCVFGYEHVHVIDKRSVSAGDVDAEIRVIVFQFGVMHLWLQH